MARLLLKTVGLALMSRSLEMSRKVGTERQKTRQASSREARCTRKVISRSATVLAVGEQGSADQYNFIMKTNI